MLEFAREKSAKKGGGNLILLLKFRPQRKQKTKAGVEKIKIGVKKDAIRVEHP